MRLSTLSNVLNSLKRPLKLEDQTNCFQIFPTLVSSSVSLTVNFASAHLEMGQNITPFSYSAGTDMAHHTLLYSLN